MFLSRQDFSALQQGNTVFEDCDDIMVAAIFDSA